MELRVQHNVVNRMMKVEGCGVTVEGLTYAKERLDFGTT